MTPEPPGPSGLGVTLRPNRWILRGYLLTAGLGLLVLLFPTDSLMGPLWSYASARSADGVVSQAGIHQMLITVRAVGAVALAVGMVGALGGRLCMASGSGTPVAPIGSEAPPPAPRDWVLTAGLTVLALGARLPGLGDGLTYDEAFSALNSVHPGEPLRALTEMVALNNHPLYSFFAALTSAPLGETEVALRLPALALGVLAVPLAYWLARWLLGWRAGLLAALFLALAPPLVRFSQSARGYAPLAFFTLLTTILLLRALARPERVRWWLYVGAAVVGAWFHFSLLPVVAGQLGGALFWVAARGRRGHAAPGLAGAVFMAGTLVLAGVSVAYGPILPELAFEVVGNTLVPRAQSGGGTDAPVGAAVWLLFENWRAGAWAIAAVVVVALSASVGAWSLRRSPGEPAFAGPLLVPVVVGLLGLLVTGGVSTRWVLFLTPLVLLLAGVGLGNAWSWSRPLALGGAALVVLAQSAGLREYYRTPPYPLQELAETVAARVDPEACLLVHWDPADVLSFYYRGPFSRDELGLASCPEGRRDRVYYVCAFCSVLEEGPWSEIPRRLVASVGEAPHYPIPYRVYALATGPGGAP